MFVDSRSVEERKPRSRSLVRRSSNKVRFRGFYLEATFCAFQGYRDREQDSLNVNRQ